MYLRTGAQTLTVVNVTASAAWKTLFRQNRIDTVRKDTPGLSTIDAIGLELQSLPEEFPGREEAERLP